MNQQALKIATHNTTDFLSVTSVTLDLMVQLAYAVALRNNVSF